MLAIAMCGLSFFPVVADTLADRIVSGDRFDDVRRIVAAAGDVQFVGVSAQTNGSMLEVTNPVGYTLRNLGLVSVKYVFDQDEKLVAIYYWLDSRFIEGVLQEFRKKHRVLDGDVTAAGQHRTVLFRSQDGITTYLVESTRTSPLGRIVVNSTQLFERYGMKVDERADSQRFGRGSSSNKSPTAKSAQ